MAIFKRIIFVLGVLIEFPLTILCIVVSAVLHSIAHIADNGMKLISYCDDALNKFCNPNR